MALETVAHISDLNASNPTSSDPKSQGDDHLRNIKLALKTDLPNITGPVTASQAELNYMVGATTQPAMKDGSNLVTPTFGDSSTKIATTAFVAAMAFSSSLPAQLGFNAKYTVKTDGFTASWQLTLPAQAGNGGRFLSTDGTNESWAFAGIKLAPAAGGALVGANCYHAFIANAAYSLPDFTGSATFGLASLSNSTAVPASVTTSDGWTIAPGLTAGTFKAISPTSSATPHGTWGALAQTPPIPASFAAASAPTLEGSVQLAAGLVVLLYSVSSRTGAYAVALNTTTNTFGAPVSLGAAATGAIPWAIYADSANTFVAGFNGGAGTVSVIAGSVAGTTITLGSATSGTYGLTSNFIQLAPGTYMYVNAPQCEVFTSSGTVVSKSANTNVGGPPGQGSLSKIDSTRALCVGLSVASPAQLKAVVISVAAGVPSGGAVASAATTILAGGTPLRFLRSLAATGPFICCAQDNTTSTTGDYYGITVAGTAATIGNVLAVANVLPAQAWPSTHIYPPATDAAQAVATYSATQMLVGIAAGGAVALSIAGTTLTSGGTFGSGSTKFATDVGTGANFYAVTGSTIDKVTVAGVTISSSYQLAVSPLIVSSDTLNSSAVNYGGTWYAWNLPNLVAAVTANKWLAISGSNINLCGPIA